MLDYSVVIPVYNEVDSIKMLYPALKKVMNGLGKPYEIIFIDDGSSDGSLEVLKEISSESNLFIVVNLKEHLGKSLALQAGFETASGEFIITMDGDLQDDPADIPKLIKKIEEGYDVICGWRYKRIGPLSKKIASKVGNYVRRLFFREAIHDVGCNLRVYSRKAVEGLKLSGERHRFITAILKKKRFKIGEIPVVHHPRRFGRSKFGNLDRLVKSVPEFLNILLR